MDWLVKHDMGPVLFREETRFFKELNSGDEVTVDVRLLMVTSDGAKWTFTHRFLKSDGTLAATIVVDGAWMSLSRRKIVVPPETLRNHIQDLEKEPEFKLIPREKKD